LDDFQSELLSFETLLEASITVQTHNFAFAAKTSHYPKRKPAIIPAKFQPTSALPPSRGTSRIQPHSDRVPSYDRPQCQICDKYGHAALDCFQRFNFSFQGRRPPSELAAMAAEANTTFEQHTWYADSGANAHITANAVDLTTLQLYNGMDTVQVGNGSGLMIHNTGSSLLNTSHNSFRLNNVLYCPQAASNLLSINQFCLDNNYYFILTGTTFFVKENKTRRLLLQGLVENGLYPINGNKNCNKQFRCFTSKLGTKATRDQWHKRLGHPSNSTLNYLSSFLPIKDSPSQSSVCSSCQLGKAKKLPFSDSQRQSARPLALIHTDVWISPVTSVGGCRYYVLFIDDFSRFTWMYPMHFKSDVFSIFQQYKILVENLFSCTIQQLQYDNGGEYLSTEFQNFLADHGIFHRLTCPYTSPQNGIAERKHRHIQEMGLTLLAQACLPNCYWVDAFFTSVYLINRLPTKVFNNITPYFVLHKTMPRYSDLRTFSCACYPYLKPYEKHKLAFRSKQCIFLGYSSQQKGYRCLDFATGRVFISRHIVFDEDTFPYLDKSHSSTTLASNQSSGTTLSSNIVHLISHAPHFNFTPPIVITNSSATESPTYTESPPLQPSAIATSIPTPSDPSFCPVIPPVLPSPILPSLILPSSPNHVSSTDPGSSPAMSPVLPRQMVTRSQTGCLKPKEFPGFKTFYST